jgi:enoyl-CoA hydratase/carnithine racemase
MPEVGNRTGSLEEAMVLLDSRDGVATITLNSPANFNVLSSHMIAALQTTFDEVAARRDVRVVVLAANGKAFCAGHDLREMRSHDDEAWHRALFDRCSTLMMTIELLPQPVIAKVQGMATAAGCQLVATCDLAIASDDARFATSGINLGLFCSTPAVAVTRIASPKRAAELLFTGEFIDAKRAVESGLINRAVPAAELDAATDALATRIASQSAAALVSGKRLLQQLRGAQQPAGAPSVAHAYELAAANMAHDMQSHDAKLGIDAFLNKAVRGPWGHR